MDVKKLAGVAGLGVMAVVLAWLAIGRGGDRSLPEHQRVRPGAEGLQANAAFDPGRGGGADPMIEAPPADDDEPIPLDEDTRINVVTPHCRQLINSQRRNVPQDTLLDMIRDQSMRFVDDDIQCLSVAGASPAVLDMANWQRNRN